MSTDGSAATPLTRPRLSLSDAAERTGVSRTTIRRRLDRQDFPHAEQDSAGRWSIPVDDLLAAGLTLSRPVVAPSDDTDRGRTVDLRTPPAGVDPLVVQVEQLQRRLAEEQARTEVERARRVAAEQVAAERAEHLETARTALRMLEAGRVPVAAPAPPGPAEGPQRDVRKHWWSRRGTAGTSSA